MGAHPRRGVRAVLIDALGTLVHLEPPAPRLREALAAEGLEVTLADARRALAAEISFYLEHHLEGHDAAALEDLRDRCAAVLGTELGLEPSRVRAPMLRALRFRAFEDAEPALAELRSRRVAVVVVSNWDCSLPEVLAAAGLATLFDGVVSSARAGAAKPSAAPFQRGLELAGVTADQALHVGDSPENDLAGARAAGVRGVLLTRQGGTPPGAICSLAELAHLT